MLQTLCAIPSLLQNSLTQFFAFFGPCDLNCYYLPFLVYQIFPRDYLISDVDTDVNSVHSPFKVSVPFYSFNELTFKRLPDSIALGLNTEGFLKIMGGGGGHLSQMLRQQAFVRIPLMFIFF